MTVQRPVPVRILIRQVLSEPKHGMGYGGAWEGPGWYIEVIRHHPDDPGEAANVILPTYTKISGDTVCAMAARATSARLNTVNLTNLIRFAHNEMLDWVEDSDNALRVRLETAVIELRNALARLSTPEERLP